MVCNPLTANLTQSSSPGLGTAHAHRHAWVNTRAHTLTHTHSCLLTGSLAVLLKNTNTLSCMHKNIFPSLCLIINHPAWQKTHFFCWNYQSAFKCKCLPSITVALIEGCEQYILIEKPICYCQVFCTNKCSWILSFSLFSPLSRAVNRRETTTLSFSQLLFALIVRYERQAELCYSQPANAGLWQEYWLPACVRVVRAHVVVYIFVRIP